MSKIIRKGSPYTNIDEFKLSELTGDQATQKVKDDRSFEPSYVSTGSQQFIPGGFDFDYEGGLSKEEIINHSTKEAEEIINKANEDAEAIRSDAHKEGFEEGKGMGYETGKTEAITVIDVFSKALDELKNTRKEFYDNAEEEMINLVANVTKTVIGEAVKEDPSLVRHAIQKAVGQLQNKEEMTIIVNSEDLAEVEKFRPELAKQVESIDKVTFKGDPNFTRGGCMVETNIGSIDARVETQLDAIRESFISAMEEKKAVDPVMDSGAESIQGDTVTDESVTPPQQDETKDESSDDS